MIVFCRQRSERRVESSRTCPCSRYAQRPTQTFVVDTAADSLQFRVTKLLFRCVMFITCPLLPLERCKVLRSACLCVCLWVCTHISTRRSASADRTARRQFQATGQPVSRTQASDAMTSRLPRYEAKCVQRMKVLLMRVGPFAFRYQGNGATPCQYIDTTRKAIECATTLPLRVYI